MAGEWLCFSRLVGDMNIDKANSLHGRKIL